MTTPTLNFYPYAPLGNKNDDMEQRSEKKKLDCESTPASRINDVNSLHNSNINKKEQTTYFKDENKRSKKKGKKYKLLTTILKSFDTFLIIATTSKYITLCVTEIGLFIIPISSAAARRLTISNKVIFGKVMQKFKKYNKQYEKRQKTIKFLIIYVQKKYKII